MESRRRHGGFSAMLAAAVVAGCGGGGGGNNGGSGAPPAALPGGVERVFPALTLDGITDLQSQAGASGAPRLYVVEKDGYIHVFDPQAAAPVPALYLDVSGLAGFDSGGEQGLLGLAFDPDYASNGFVYVHLVKTDGDRRVVIARFRDDGMPPVDPATEVIVLEATDFDALPGVSNHVAGALAFGPADGYLYLTMGDGGSSFDPNGAAQDRTDLRGSILRIDVGATAPGGPAPNYAIPPDNPFVGEGGDVREEIYAFGMRNPFRLTIEATGGGGQRVWVGDVGQGEREEVDLIQPGRNYGWDCREGTRTVSDANDSPACDALADGDFEPPVHEYGRDLGRSITGGYVYSGERLAAALGGRYVYGDFGSGRIWALDPDSGANDLLVDTDLAISTFGTGADGELYIADFRGGLYRLVP